MASFEDLPHDVLWLIFQKTIKHVLSKYDNDNYFAAFEDGTSVYNTFQPNWHYVQQTKWLALIKQSLRLIKKKCKRTDKTHWVFIKGALTQKYMRKK
jgi:hypothetical protein